MRMWLGRGNDGALVPPEVAALSVFDRGFTVGDGVFETMKAVDGRLFLWPWHLERLRVSANRMQLLLPADAVLTDVVRAVAAEALGSMDHARIRLTITSGVGPMGSSRSAAEPTVVCAAAPIPLRQGGAKLHIASWPRNERSPLVGVKSTSYAEHVLALAEAQAVGADEAIFCNTRDELSEGTGSNVFIVRHGAVVTPPLAAGLLPGVTRRFVLGLADAALPIAELPVERAALADADEVFITSSLQDIRGVSAVNDRSLPLGPVTAELQRRFALRAADDECWT